MPLGEGRHFQLNAVEGLVFRMEKSFTSLSYFAGRAMCLCSPGCTNSGRVGGLVLLARIPLPRIGLPDALRLMKRKCLDESVASVIPSVVCYRGPHSVSGYSVGRHKICVPNMRRSLLPKVIMARPPPKCCLCRRFCGAVYFDLPISLSLGGQRLAPSGRSSVSRVAAPPPEPWRAGKGREKGEELSAWSGVIGAVGGRGKVNAAKALSRSIERATPPGEERLSFLCIFFFGIYDAKFVCGCAWLGRGVFKAPIGRSDVRRERRKMCRLRNGRHVHPMCAFLLRKRNGVTEESSMGIKNLTFLSFGFILVGGK